MSQHPQGSASWTPPQLNPSDTRYLPLKDGGTMVDMDAYIVKMRADLSLRGFYMQTYQKTEAEFYEWYDTQFQHDLRARTSPVVTGARPLPENTSTRYTHVPSIHDDYPSLTIRWWLDPGDRSQYNFDFIDPMTGQAISPDNLLILLRENRCWQKIKSLAEAVQTMPSLRFYGPPRWVALPGSRFRMIRSTDNSVLGEVFAPQIPSGKYPQYMPCTTLADALKNNT